MAQKGKAINVKIATPKIIKALNEALDKLNKDYAEATKANKAWEKDVDTWKEKCVQLAVKHIAKAENFRVSTNWRHQTNVDFDIPASVVKFPEAPESLKNQMPEWQYEQDKAELENAIRILKLTDEEVVSTSTYNAVARFL